MSLLQLAMRFNIESQWRGSVYTGQGVGWASHTTVGGRIPPTSEADRLPMRQMPCSRPAAAAAPACGRSHQKLVAWTTVRSQPAKLRIIAFRWKIISPLPWYDIKPVLFSLFVRTFRTHRTSGTYKMGQKGIWTPNSEFRRFSIWLLDFFCIIETDCIFVCIKSLFVYFSTLTIST